MENYLGIDLPQLEGIEHPAAIDHLLRSPPLPDLHALLGDAISNGLSVDVEPSSDLGEGEVMFVELGGELDLLGSEPSLPAWDLVAVDVFVDRGAVDAVVLSQSLDGGS